MPIANGLVPNVPDEPTNIEWNQTAIVHTATIDVFLAAWPTRGCRHVAALWAAPAALTLLNSREHGRTHSDRSRLAAGVKVYRRWASAAPQQRLVVVGGDLNFDGGAHLSYEALIKTLETDDATAGAMDSSVVMALRFSIATVAMGAFVVGGRLLQDSTTGSTTDGTRAAAAARPTADSGAFVVGAAELAVWLYLGFMTQAVGLQFTQASSGALLGSLTVVVVPLLSMLDGKKIGIASWASVGLAVLGIVLFVGPGALEVSEALGVKRQCQDRPCKFDAILASEVESFEHEAAENFAKSAAAGELYLLKMEEHQSFNALEDLKTSSRLQKPDQLTGSHAKVLLGTLEA
ncbi:unnamed protein product [Prorocentrum cordatum]|uniref:EamA domain-containing protein n=1 Tax=Prorocentrum cordatum TaxID=2364126 RepID=A0ABN9U8S6_9DINO|nr:unnamed protein product [Polarella glacialis]